MPDYTASGAQNLRGYAVEKSDHGIFVTFDLNRRLPAGN